MTLVGRLHATTCSLETLSHMFPWPLVNDSAAPGSRHATVSDTLPAFYMTVFDYVSVAEVVKARSRRFTTYVPSNTTYEGLDKLADESLSRLLYGVVPKKCSGMYSIHVSSVF